MWWIPFKTTIKIFTGALTSTRSTRQQTTNSAFGNYHFLNDLRTRHFYEIRKVNGSIFLLFLDSLFIFLSTSVNSTFNKIFKNTNLFKRCYQRFNQDQRQKYESLSYYNPADFIKRSSIFNSALQLTNAILDTHFNPTYFKITIRLDKNALVYYCDLSAV